MSTSRIQLLCAFLILNFFCENVLASQRGFYTIVAPGTVRPDSIFHVSFTLTNFQKSCWFNLSLTSFPEHNKIYDVESIEVKPGTTKLVKFHPPSFNGTIGVLNVIGYRGIISKETAKVYFQPHKYWAFIQTNKHKYKPGELVKFRVICIDQLKRPAKLNKDIIVQIYDNENNLIKNTIDVKLVQGVFRSEFQLSDFPVLGLWRINVRSGNKNLAGKFFEVDRYKLPKFNVKITTKNVAIAEDQITLEIHATYFYGEPVKGKLLISLTNINAPKNKLISTLRKESQIDGKTTIVLSLENDLQLKKQSSGTDATYPTMLYKFHIAALVIDDLSEEQSWFTTELEIHNSPYKIELEAPSGFDSDEIFKIKVKVFITDLQGNFIRDNKNPTEIIIGCYQKANRYSTNYIYFEEIRNEYKNQIGEDFAIINITNKNYTECYMYGEYQRTLSRKYYMDKRANLLKFDILTESPQEGKELEIKITNPNPIEEFSYEISSKGDIIQSDQVNVPGNQTTYILRLNVTFLMVPKITIYIHHIKNMSFIGELRDVIIKRAFQNSIEIETEYQTKPGASVNINVTTDEGSYVGLMGLDRSALQSINKKDILNDDYVRMKLASENSLHYPYSKPFSGGRVADVIFLSNLFPPQEVLGEDIDVLTPPHRIRKLFPESWLYLDFEMTPPGGLKFMETAPDTITTWAITGFSIHPETGLSFTKNTTNLKVFQEFFVSMDFPSLVKEGEIIEIPIYISNYMNQDALTNVTIHTDSEELNILDHPEDISKPKLFISKLISANKREKVVFFMKPLKQGNYNVTVQAISSVARDAVQKTLNVQPEGIPNVISKTYLVHLPEEGIQENEITIDIPENAAPGSERVEVSVVGDIFQPLMMYLQNLTRVPYGNGEENMRLIISNSIVLKYLKVLNYSNPILETKIRTNIELGYQNQLSFKFLDGSFGLFDRSVQRTGDIWQTVFSLWGLEQANEFVRVDPDIIDRGLEYLHSKQQTNGCLKSESGLEEDVKFTAFGLMAFLMDKHFSSTYNEVILKGLEFLNEINDDLEYSPVSAMSAYALLLGKHEKAGNHLKRLTSNSHLTSKQTLWTRSETLQSHLEAIAGNLVSLFESKGIPEQSILYIVRGLVDSKIDDSSITHMIALQAMIEFVEKLFLSKTNLEVTFKDDQNKSGDFLVNAENSQVLQTFQISQNSRKIKIKSKGHGFAVVDVKYNYNLVPENKSSSFYAIEISSKKTSKHLEVLKICSNFPTNNTQNKLTIMEVNLPSGFIFTEKDSQEVQNLGEQIKSVQVNDARDKFVVYYEITFNEACIYLEVRKSYMVFNSKPGWVIVYDSHDKDHKYTRSFSIN